MADRVPNWGPSAGQPVPDAQWAAYMQQNPPPEGASFTAGPAIVGSDGTPGTTTGYAPGTTPTDVVQDSTREAAAGGIGGLDYWSNYFANPQSVNYTGFDATNANQAQGFQRQLMQDLYSQASGSLNTQAQQSLAQGYGQAAQGASALASGQRGTGGGAGLRAGVTGQGMATRNQTSDQSQLRAQEMQQGNAALMALYNQMQGQDIDQANGVANASLGAQGLQNDYQQWMLSQGLNTATQNAQYAIDYAGTKAGTDIAAQNLAAASNQRLVGTGATAMGALANMGFGSGDNNTPYRQVDGEDSIVPEDDK